jgi:microcystin-dependent protein
MIGWGWAPLGWALCTGQLLSIDQNSALFSLYGTTYGGDGVTTFGIPDLRSRVALHMGNRGQTNFPQGQMAGSEQVTLTRSQLATHTHTIGACVTGTTENPLNGFYGGDSANALYGAPDGSVTSNQEIKNNGGSQPHDNMMPYQCINFIVALEGIYPSRP